MACRICYFSKQTSVISLATVAYDVCHAITHFKPKKIFNGWPALILMHDINV